MSWRLASFVFFTYVAAVAPATGGPRARRVGALTGAVVGLALTGLVSSLPPHPVIHEWLAPPVLLLIGYWSSGLLFAGPMPRAERALIAFDRALRVRQIAARLPRAAVEILEASYAGVYPLIPAGLLLHLAFAPVPDAERFWTVILATDYVCFAVLPWVQTRPPRALEPEPPWHSTLRPLNLRLLGSASIEVNTFPSGHAAEALAVMLLVSDGPWPVTTATAAAALGVSAGAVLGRYHYAADVLAGWLVAALVWAWVRPM